MGFDSSINVIGYTRTMPNITLNSPLCFRLLTNINYLNKFLIGIMPTQIKLAPRLMEPALNTLNFFINYSSASSSWTLSSLGRIVGKSITSRIDAESVKNITNRSIPIPSPPVGGSPYSKAWTKSSSIK